MNEPFIADFRVNIGRSEVIYQENITTLEPKVLKVLKIYQWIGDDQLLLSISQGKQTQVLQFDISTGNSQIIHEGAIRWAQMDDQQSLYISNLKGQIVKMDDGYKIILPTLKSLVAHKRFLIEANNLLLNDDSGNIWRLDLISKTLDKLNTANQRSSRLDDIDLVNQRLLYLSFIAGKKEIVLFH